MRAFKRLALPLTAAAVLSVPLARPAAAETRTFGGWVAIESPGRVRGELHLPAGVTNDYRTCLVASIGRGGDRYEAVLTIQPTDTSDPARSRTPFRGRIVGVVLPDAGPYEAQITLAPTMTVSARVTIGTANRISGELLLPAGVSLDPDVAQETSVTAVVARGDTRVGAILSNPRTDAEGRTLFEGRIVGPPLPPGGPYGAVVVLFLPSTLFL